MLKGLKERIAPLNRLTPKLACGVGSPT